MPESVLLSVVNLGAAGLLIWFLWESGKKKDATIERKDARIKGLYEQIDSIREKHAQETKALREEIAGRDAERLRDSTQFGEVLWQILSALQTMADHTRQEMRRNLALKNGEREHKSPEGTQ